MNEYGSKIWMIGDGYYPADSVGMKSHESVCVLNTTQTPAQLKLTLYFEDRPPLTGFAYTVQAQRCAHIRMDALKNGVGEGVPMDVPYAILVESDTPVAVQYSRMDTRQAEMALMTTLGYAL